MTPDCHFSHTHKIFIKQIVVFERLNKWSEYLFICYLLLYSEYSRRVL